jgi:pimeloyl-ACP methyl ester carboxylesterase/DNA-binding winged helix-turn-helix (wHTH) protein
VVYEFGDIEIDPGIHEVRRAGEVVAVEPQVFDVLAHLIEHRDRTVTKEQLLDAVWGNRFVSESAVTSRIKAARRAVGDDGRAQAVIRTVHGRGYRFVAPITERGSAADAPAATRTGGADAPGAGGSRRPPRTRYASSGRHSIAYQVVDDRPPGGDGAPEPIVFVPGFVSNVELQWDLPAMADAFTRLGRGRQLVLFDKRGTGVSERVALDAIPTLEERMDDVRAVMDAAGIRRAALVGISEGGPLSLLFAAAHPDRVSRLALFGTYAHHPLDPIGDLLERTRTYWGSGSAFEFLAPSWAGVEDTRRFFARYERQSASPEAAASIVAMANEIDIRPVLASINQPTLIVHRAGDGVFDVSGARELASGIAGAQLVELSGDDHFLFTDADPVLDAIERFLASDATTEPTAGARTTALTTLVAVAGSDGPDADSVRAAWAAVAGEGSSVVAPEPVCADGAWVVAVDGPARAVRLAQRLLAGDTASGWRAGVHTAEVELVGVRPTGTGLAIAVAVADDARPGEVLVTRTLTDLVAGSGLGFRYHGALDVGDVGGRWELYAPVPSPTPSS